MKESEARTLSLRLKFVLCFNIPEPLKTKNPAFTGSTYSIALLGLAVNSKTCCNLDTKNGLNWPYSCYFSKLNVKTPASKQ
jgi:hypothetical protein